MTTSQRRFMAMSIMFVTTTELTVAPDARVIPRRIALIRGLDSSGDDRPRPDRQYFVSDPLRVRRRGSDCSLAAERS